MQLKSEPNGGLRILTSLAIVLGVARAKVRVATKPVPELVVTVATRCARDPQTAFRAPSEHCLEGTRSRAVGPPAAAISGGSGCPHAVDGGQGSAAFQVWIFKKIILPFMVQRTHAHFKEFRRF